MMFKKLAVGAMVSAVALSVATTGFAKGHAQGLGGAGLAGKGLAGLVDDGQKNAGVENKSALTTYGRSDAVIEAQDGINEQKDLAAETNAARKN